MDRDSPDLRQARSRDGEGLTRRDFLRLTGGVVVLFSLGAESRAQAAEGRPSPLPEDPNSWLAISPDSRVTIFAPAPELGQGVRTSLAQMAAEELTIPVSAIDMVAGDTDRVAPDMERQAAPTIATVGVRVRRAAAEAREILAGLAAEQWGVRREAIRIQDGRAVLRDDPATSIRLGELARGRRLVRRLSSAAAPTPSAECRVIGQPIPRVEGRSLVTGECRFVADLRPANLAYASLLRPPCLGASLVRADTRRAAEQPGVIAVVEQADFVAVVATRPDLAQRALRHVQLDWREPEHPAMSSLYRDLRDTARLAERIKEVGDVEGALASARFGFSASYRTSFVAHAPLEPHGALASQEDGGIVVYASTQRPFAHRRAVAEALGVPAERVRVIVPPVGGAFGGKDAPDISVHAARLASTVRRPVLLSQTREEELACNYFGPAGIVDIQCGVSAAGEVVAYACDVFNSGPRGATPPYAFPNLRVRSYSSRSPLPQGRWRGLPQAVNAFAREVHLDHVAAELGHDPIQFRLRHLAGDARMARAIQAAAERYGWQRRRAPSGLGLGFACATDAGSCVALIAEVEVSRLSGEVRARRVVVAHDCGLIVNPDGLRNQIEGAVMMGIGLALREAVRYEQGRILTDSFASYSIPTLRDVPGIEIVLIPNPEHPPQGGGTPAITPVAAAVANAVFDATGRRLRDLPLTPGRVLAALQPNA